MDDTVNIMMEGCAQEAVDDARRQGADLDFSLESLRHVDAFLLRQHEAIPKGWRKLLGGGPSAETLAKLSKIWGGYVGEVMRRQWGGYWEIPKGGPHQGELFLKIGYQILSPPARVLGCINGGSEESVYNYVSELGGQLGK